jgi:peptide/nickel transport system permease protein
MAVANISSTARHTGALLSLARRHPGASIPLVFLLGIVLVSLVGPTLGTGDAEFINPVEVLTSPSREFPFGNDHLGRSVLARLVIALRVSLGLAITSALLAAIVGGLMGLIAGYVGGIVDEIVMRLMDTIFAFPVLLMAVLIAALLGPGIKGVIITIIIVTCPSFSRVVRGPTLSVRERDYVTAARAMGASPVRIVLRHVLPNVMAAILVQLSYTLSVALIIEGSLSFLGLGVQPPFPSLGSLLSDGKVYMEAAWWLVAFPGVTLALAIIAINVSGDWLRDFWDPRLRRLAR